MEELYTKLFSEVFIEMFKSEYPEFKKRAGKFSKEYDLFGIASNRYFIKTFERYSMIRVLGMTEPIPLLNLYIRVNILKSRAKKTFNYLKFNESISKKIENGEFQEPEILDSAQIFDPDTHQSYEEFQEVISMDESLSVFGEEYEVVDAKLLLNSERKIIILGKPGAGKTTFLKYLLLSVIKEPQSFKNVKLPVFISLKAYSGSKCDLIDFIVHELDVSNFPEARDFVIRLLERGKCLLLFDGLDEVLEESLNNLITEVIDFSDKYSNNQFIISCRVAAYNHWFTHFKDVELANFDRKQVERFVTNWFFSEPDMAKNCLEKLLAEIRLMDLASNPLLLTLLCINFNEFSDFPKSRAELYKEAIDTLLTKWDSGRRIARNVYGDFMSIKRKRALYCTIAINTFDKGQYLINKIDLLKIVTEFLSSINEKNIDIDEEVLLQKLEISHGLLIQRSYRDYSFSHLSIQEYFSAQYIVENFNSGSIDDMIRTYLWNIRWQEVLIISANLLFDPTDFLLVIVKEINNYINNRFLLKKIVIEILPLAQEISSEIFAPFLFIADTFIHATEKVSYKIEDNSPSENVALMARRLYRVWFDHYTSVYMWKIRDQRSLERYFVIFNNLNSIDSKDFLYALTILSSALKQCDLKPEKREMLEKEIFKFE